MPGEADPGTATPPVTGEAVRRRNIGELFAQKKSVSEASLLQTTSTRFGFPLWNELPSENIRTEFTRLVPIQYLRKHKMVPVETADQRVIAIHDPANF